MSRRFTILLVATLAITMLAAPAFGNSQGPPWLHNDRIIPEEGCSCHGAGDHPVTRLFFPFQEFQESTKNREHTI